MKVFIGHHTCSMGGGFTYVMENAPFISIWPKEDDEDPREPYLGEGYYFWECDLKQAQKWGKQWYQNWYYIIQAGINTTNENFLDLIGDKQKIGMFLLMRNKLISDKSIDETFTLGEIIEFLKKAEKLKPGIFPYKIIRAQDYKVLQKNNRLFFRRFGGYTYLDPSHIFCLLEKNDLILTNKKIIFQSRT